MLQVLIKNVSMLQVLVSRGQSVDPVYDKFLAYLNTGPCIGANPNGDQDAWDACKAVRDLMFQHMMMSFGL
jgi:hypothetical protein